ncbi:TetR/AcrR family transcriptional regulator [Microbulbifer rhizosphaerae]|uniref:TetR/AcrR family transcriptional regulator n=1 Tax=Microbulbifer rhizosphaerae TaxID=1562603 RepID=A0A7W4WEQ5_9GAMM|nr:TetR/AcrR family transcriptional regulator [Microbulbifer rhizosphaerae]MBB3062870.1 TetR/AcrR family transcriptional regulator [Microbulbifer rhizosphaerae]
MGGNTAERKKTYKRGKIRDHNLELILGAAREEFVLKGFKGASIQAIADRAGLPKANIHYYFKTKPNLYLAVLEEIIGLWNDHFDEINVEDDPAGVLDRFIRQKVELSYTHPQSSKLFAMEIIQGAPHLKNYMRNKMRPWVRKRAEVIEAWIADGRMKPVDPTHLIFLIWSSTQHYADFETQVLTILNRAEYERSMIDEIADFLSRTILAGVGLEPPERSAHDL